MTPTLAVLLILALPVAVVLALGLMIRNATR